MDRGRATQLVTFLETIDRLKSVYRSTYIPGTDRHENDAEHTWHMALFALLLCADVDLPMDRSRMFELVLVHDLVEIIAGDTPAYDVQGRIDAREREARAAEELFRPLPPDVRDRLHAAWREFEDGDTPEAVYARAMDRLQGFSQNVFSGGRAWRERGVTEEMTRRRNQVVMDLHPALAMVCDLLYERATGNGMWDTDPVDGS
ncbi:MAG: HD domain-containing protein [Chloroflexota bacterium]